ncbi:unnamed protein product, partial [Porites evermanni]
SWSEWGPCSKTCSGGVQSRFRNCTQSEREWHNCTNNKIQKSRLCQNRPCSDFAIKCYQCHGSEEYCHHSLLQRNQTRDACNRNHDRCILKWFELDNGNKEVTRGCGSEEECRLASEKCNRKTVSYTKCHVTCCGHHYCNEGSLFGCRLHNTHVIIFGVYMLLIL